MSFDYLKKYIIAFLIILILCSSLFFSSVKQSEAAMPVVEVGGNLAANVTSAVENTALTAKDTVLDTLAYLLAKIVLASMTQEIVNWINSGFEGSPSFVQDPASYFTDVADQASGAFITQLGAEDLFCSPWKLDVLSGLDLTYSYSTPSLSRFQCTLGEAVESWDAFMDDFIEGGGWKSWLSVTVEQQNNPFGAYFMAVDEAEKRRAAAEESAKLEASWGGGFVSLKECDGGSINHEDWCDKSCDPNQNSNVQDSDICFNTCMLAEGNLSTDSLCKLTGGTMKNTTPGAIIADQLKINLGSSVRQIELADEINESLAAIFNALISQLITTGLSSLTSTSNENEDTQWYNEEPSDQETENTIEGIDYYIGYEYQYRDAKQASANAYNETINKLELLRSCYQSQIPVNQARIAEIQAEINSYEAAKDYFEEAVLNSQNLIDEAGALKTDIYYADNYTDFEALLNEFTYEVQPGMHTYEGVQGAQSENESIESALDTENSAIDAEYSQCLSGTI